MKPTAPRKLSRPQIEEAVAAMYRGFFGRKPEPQGLKHWADSIETDEAALALLGGFLLSDEYQSKISGPLESQELAAAFGAILDEEATLSPVVVVDVGAQRLEGEDHVYSPLFRYAKTRVTGFEPLQHRLQERDGIHSPADRSMLPTFIGDGRSHTFHLNHPDATSSLLPLNREVTAELVDLDHVRTNSTEIVPTVTLDEALGDIGRVDLLKLDIQGFEHPVLCNAPRTLSRTLVVHCEVEFIPLYQDQSLFSEVDQALRAAGFRFLDFSHLCRYPFKNRHSYGTRDQLGWADAVYFKEKALIEEPAGLIIQALVALAVYEKASLAAHLIKEYDARTGRSLLLMFDPR